MNGKGFNQKNVYICNITTCIMNTFIKKSLAMVVLFGMAAVAFADRGVGKKNKSKVLLNISTPSTLRNSIAANLKTGLMYKGSLLSSQLSVGNNSIMNNSIVTYQKGNTVYIIPYKRKIVMPDISQGYTGMKLIIKSKK